MAVLSSVGGGPVTTRPPRSTERPAGRGDVLRRTSTALAHIWALGRFSSFRFSGGGAPPPAIVGPMASEIGATPRGRSRATGADGGNGADLLGRTVEDPSGPRPDPVPGRPAQDRVLRALRHRLPILLACAIITPVAAFLISNAQTEQYTATSTLLFRDLNLDQKLFGTSSFTPSTDPQRQADTDVKLASQREVAQRAAAVLHLPVDTVANAVSVAPNGQSDLVDINVTAPSPAQAARIANAFADEYIVYSRDADRQQVGGAQALVQHQLDALPATDRAGVAGAQLRKQVQQLNLLAAVQTGN